MATILSPASSITSAAMAHEPMTARDFAAKLAEIKKNVNILLRLTRDCAKDKERQVTIGDRVFSFEDLKDLKAQLFENISGLKQGYSDAKKSRRRRATGGSTRSGAQLQNLHVISDQLINMLAAGNLGTNMTGEVASRANEANRAELFALACNVDAMRRQFPGARPLQEVLELVFTFHLANSSILTSLFSLYITVNNLNPGVKGARIHPDGVMERFFGAGSNTHFTFRGVRLDGHVRRILPTVDADLRANLEEHLRQADMSAFTRLRTAPRKEDTRRSDVPYYVERGMGGDYGLVNEAKMKLTSYFIIPDVVAQGTAAAEVLATRENPDFIRGREEVSAFLKGTTEAFKRLRGV